LGVKLLVLTSRFPYPLEKGDKLRIFHQIRELSSNHEIVLCTLAEDVVQEADYQEVKSFCTRIHIIPLSQSTVVKNTIFNTFKGIPLPFQVSYFYDKKIKKQIAEIIKAEQPDHIYTQLARMAEYAKEVNIPKTLDYMDAFSIGAERRAESSNWLTRWFWKIEARKMAKYEAQIGDKFNNLTIISEQDRDTLLFNQKNDIHIVPNGVELDFFKKGDNTLPPQYDIAFIGNLGYYPNVEAAKYLVQRILPLLLKEIPSIKILIAGARPTSEVWDLASANVTVKGWVDDIRESYEATQLLVAPLFHGSGQQNKILEAMAMEIPCVTTQLVNSAILATQDSEISIANTEEEFAQKIVFLLKRPDFRGKMSKNGRLFVEKRYSWKSSTLILNAILESKTVVNQLN
jgi:polysaccharide biosynthesis protein PslH